jgi:tetratricopeptide (TPR) repeat protein
VPAPTLAASILGFAAVLWAVLMPLGMADPTGLSAQDEVTAKQFADAIGGGALDPQSPDMLSTRLGFAELLAKSEGGDCRMRLENAQKQLDMARQSQAGFALPSALAREAAVDYQIHVGRASCDSGAAVLRDQELRAAVESARRAVDLYKDEFDAVSMVTMQFNLGVTYHELGESGAAFAALQTALQMDREYGFREDANDNYRTILQWKGQPAVPDEIAALTKDYPQRSTTLSFGWFDSKAALTLTLDYEQLSEGDRLSMHGMESAERRVRRRIYGWNVSFEPDGARYDINHWPNDESSVPGTVASLTRMALQFHDFDLARAGRFTLSTAVGKFESNMRSDVKGVTESLAAANVSARLTQQVRNESDLYAKSLDAVVAEAYDMETGTWIGASLDQGVWYDMSVPLSLPLAPRLFVTHQVEFAFTRQVPCTAGSAEEACVEIVLRATPDPTALRQLILKMSDKIGQGQREALQLSAAAYMRLVIEPKTLQFYDCDIRRYGYWAGAGLKFDHPVMAFERAHVVSGPIVRTE